MITYHTLLRDITVLQWFSSTGYMFASCTVQNMPSNTRNIGAQKCRAARSTGGMSTANHRNRCTHAMHMQRPFRV